MGNVFASEEDALMQVETLKVIQELKQCKGYRPFVAGSANYSMFYDTETGKLPIESEYYLIGAGISGVFYDTGDNCTSAINKVGKQRIINAMKWYYCKQAKYL
jgi:hypothetical protein